MAGKMAAHNYKPLYERINGPLWKALREKIISIHETLLSINDSIIPELTTIYVKYKVSNSSLFSVFAVMWVKTTKEVVVGLATQDRINHQAIIDPPSKMKYRGLVSYIRITAADEVPKELNEWAQNAYMNIKGNSEHVSD